MINNMNKYHDDDDDEIVISGHFWRIFSICKAKAKVKAKTLHLTDETNDNVCAHSPLW